MKNPIKGRIPEGKEGKSEYKKEGETSKSVWSGETNHSWRCLWSYSSTRRGETRDLFPLPFERGNESKRCQNKKTPKKGRIPEGKEGEIGR